MSNGGPELDFNFLERIVTLLVLSEECHMTFNLVNRLYELFHQGVESLHGDVSHPPNPRQVTSKEAWTMPSFFC